MDFSVALKGAKNGEYLHTHCFSIRKRRLKSKRILLITSAKYLCPKTTIIFEDRTFSSLPLVANADIDIKDYPNLSLTS
jgi:hypothetical protein